MEEDILFPGDPSGTNVVSDTIFLTQAEYDALTPSPTVLYVITG